MAQFHIREVEGMRQIWVEIENETIRAAKGAMSNTAGNIDFVPRLPSLYDLYRGLFTVESRIRPQYSGTGTVHLQPSISGFHILDVGGGDTWILEPGIYWASEDKVRLGFHRDPFLPSLWAGDGLFAWKTTLRGTGRVAINTPGPVEEIVVKGGDLRVQGRLVLGRTSGLRFRSQRPARFPRNLISGQQRLRVFEGSGKALVCWTPYWNEYMFGRMTGGETIKGTIFE